MKNIKTYIQTIFVFFAVITSINAQTTKELGEYNLLEKGEVIDGFDCDCKDESLENISFGYDMAAALYAHELIKIAQDKNLKEWFDTQHDIIKEEIEKQLGFSFPNFEQARNTFYKSIERVNVSYNYGGVRNKYSSYMATRNAVHIESLSDLKLLRLRENELKSGNITNSLFGSLQYNGTPLDQITSLEQLSALWNTEVAIFEDNNWRYHNDIYTFRKLAYDIGKISDYTHDILSELLSKQLEHYDSYDRWEQLDLMQMYLNKVRTLPPLLYQEIYAVDYATPTFIEEYAIRKRDGGLSVFDPTYPVVNRYLFSNDFCSSFIDYSQWEELKENTLDGMLDDERIINELSGKAECVFNKMIGSGSSNNINWILENFIDGSSPSEFNLIFKMSSTLGNLTNASIATPKQSGVSNTFVISINENTLSGRTSLGLARTIIHESIHARLWEFYYRNGTGVTPNDFPGIYEYMRVYGKNWDHEQMAAYYRETIAKGLKQYDNAQHSDAYYDALAWEGLSEIKDANNNHDLIYTEAWKKLTTIEQTAILQIITNEKINGSKDCQ